MERERFGSRLGFILISAGCAIGLGNVWRFPYIVGQYGGALFILIYLAFLVIFGLPIMTMEFSVGRASQKSVASSFKELQPKGTKWQWFGGVGMVGNYILMMFYTTITGWMFAYFFKMILGDFYAGQSTTEVNAEFSKLVGNPIPVVVFMIIAVALGVLICSLGLKNGLERVNKIMMVALLAIVALLAVRSVTLPGAAEGLKYYLVPSVDRMLLTSEDQTVAQRLGEVIFAAMGQAFFTLSVGMGSMAIFGSYISKDRRLLGESVSIALLDTFVAFTAGLIIIPACFAYGINPGAGPSLIFQTLPNVFNSMPGGNIWGILFFLFMIFAALSTVSAVIENIICMGMDMFGWNRKKSCIINVIAVTVLSLPCALGFNLLSFIQPLGEGTGILDLEDFIVSSNILPLGSAVYVFFCTWKRKGWGWDNFIEEANSGKGLAFPRKLRFYCTYILPVILIAFWLFGIITTFI